MTISMQTLNDTLIALLVTVGIAVAVSIAFVAAAAFAERGKARAANALRAARPAQHHVASDTRELVHH